MKRSFASVLIAALVTLSTVASLADSSLVTRAGKPTPNAFVPLAEELAAAVTQDLHQPTGAADLVEGMPKALHAVFVNSYQADSLRSLVAKYAGYQRAFDERWAAVSARAKLVSEAVDKAKALSASKDYARARETLLAVVTSAGVDDEGKILPRADILLAMDAELPALQALAALARDSHDPFLLPDLVVAMTARRRLMSDKQSEAYVWMAHYARLARAREEGNALSSFGAGMTASIGRALERIDRARDYLLTKDGMLMAQGFFHNLKKLGLAKGEVTVQASVTVGAYGLFDLITAGPGMNMKVDAKNLKYAIDLHQGFPVNCRETDKPDGYDAVTNKFTYRQVCETKLRDTKITLAAALRAAPPEWARSSHRVWVLGKVKSAEIHDDGKVLRGNWVLTDAEVVDFRLLGVMSIIDFGDAAASLF